MLFPKEFIKLQFIFAEKVSRITNQNFCKALFEYTSMPIRVGVPFSDLTEKHQSWQTFIKMIKSKDDYDQAYDIHYERAKDAAPTRLGFGCFSFDYLKDKKSVRLHFTNNDKSDPDVLSDYNREKRLAELKLMFQEIKKIHPHAEKVVSSSWLYNIEKFKRLFPNEFFQSTSVSWDFRSLGIWGQFIDKNGECKKDIISAFIMKVNQSDSLEDLKNAFGLKNISCQAPIYIFYEKYNAV